MKYLIYILIFVSISAWADACPPSTAALQTQFANLDSSNQNPNYLMAGSTLFENCAWKQISKFGSQGAAQFQTAVKLAAVSLPWDGEGASPDFFARKLLKNHDYEVVFKQALQQVPKCRADYFQARVDSMKCHVKNSLNCQAKRSSPDCETPSDSAKCDELDQPDETFHACERQHASAEKKSPNNGIAESCPDLFHNVAGNLKKISPTVILSSTATDSSGVAQNFSPRPGSPLDIRSNAQKGRTGSRGPASVRHPTAVDYDSSPDDSTAAKE